MVNGECPSLLQGRLSLRWLAVIERVRVFEQNHVRWRSFADDLIPDAEVQRVRGEDRPQDHLIDVHGTARTKSSDLGGVPAIDHPSPPM